MKTHRSELVQLLVVFAVGCVLSALLIELARWRRQALEYEARIRSLSARLDEQAGDRARAPVPLEASQREALAADQPPQTEQAPRPDNLTLIRGIGPVYQDKLRNGGIRTFAQLAGATPEQIRTVLAVPEWRKIEPEAWIAQAKELARP